MAPSKSKKRKRSLLKLDMLSNLPQKIKEKILTYLPIKEAGRTSILSSKWRYIWTSIPELKFIDNEIIEDPNNSESVLVNVIDAVFARHNGPIRKFSLFTEETLSDVSRWIENFSKDEIREIELDLSYSEESSYSIMHSNFFAWDELNCAKLKNCYFELPLWFEGFKLLDTLEIRDSLISRRYLEKLVSSCSLLKKLILILNFHFDPKSVMKIHVSNLKHLEIKDMSKAEIVDLERCDLQICAQKLETLKLYGSFNDTQIIAPNLKSLEMKGRYFDFQLSAPNLSYLCIQLEPHYGDDRKDRNFIRYIDNVPDLKKVHIKDIKNPVIEPWTEEFLLLSRLNHLILDIDFELEKEPPLVLALFQRALNLHSLQIVGYGPSERRTPAAAALWANMGSKDDLFKFKHIQTVNMVNFRAVDSVLSFVKFQLGSAEQLLTLTIEEDTEYKVNERVMFEELLRFPRASPKAEIRFRKI